MRTFAAAAVPLLRSLAIYATSERATSTKPRRLRSLSELGQVRGSVRGAAGVRPRARARFVPLALASGRQKRAFRLGFLVSLSRPTAVEQLRPPETRASARSLLLDGVEKLADLGDNTFGVLLDEVVAARECRLLSVRRQLQPGRLILSIRLSLRSRDDA